MIFVESCSVEVIPLCWFCNVIGIENDSALLAFTIKFPFVSVVIVYSELFNASKF